jgi:streptomycin 6-kinase
LTLGAAFESTAAWVAVVTRADGSSAVLKVSLPHFEGEDEIAGLRFWAGNPTVHLLQWDASHGAMLLERCQPGTPLSTLPEPDQDHIVAGLIRRLWRVPPSATGFRPLSAMIGHWVAETRRQSARWPDPDIVERGLAVFDQLVSSASDRVLLGTDVHAGNVLMAEREPWLLIDPKPFVGDPAFDATQHLLNCRGRLRSDLPGTIRRFANLLDVNPERVGRWLFARLAAEPREDWAGDTLALAQRVRSHIGAGE